jgi:hypothetical protein
MEGQEECERFLVPGKTEEDNQYITSEKLIEIAIARIFDYFTFSKAPLLVYGQLELQLLRQATSVPRKIYVPSKL